MSEARRIRRQQEREQSKAIGMKKKPHTPLQDLANGQMDVIKSEIERIRQEAYTQGCNDGYEAGHDEGFKTGKISGMREGYQAGWNDAYKKMSLDIIDRVVSVALKVVRDYWGKFAFKKKEERPRAFGYTLAACFEEYLGKHLDNKEKQDELRQLMHESGFIYRPGGEDGAEKS